MLSPMSSGADDKNDSLREELTDGVIETLYDIIRRAQSTTHTTRTSKSIPGSSHISHPTSPASSALFKAYEHVLAEQGLQPSDDAILHRFLFRMQEDRRDNEGLVQRFKRVLDDIGIQIEVDEEGEGVEVTTDMSKGRDATRNGAVAALGRHSRRGSFDSFFDGTADKVAGTDYGDMALRPRRGSHAEASNGHGNRRAVSDTGRHSYQPAQLPIRNNVNGHAHRRSLSGQQPRQKRSASVSSRGSLQIRRGGLTNTSRVGDYDADDSEHTDRTTSLDLSHVQVPGINAPIPAVLPNKSHQHQQYAPEPFRPSDTRLLDDAETLEEQRLHRVARECIQTWRDRTQERRSIRDDMERLAVAFDRRILLKLSFEQLSDTSRIRRSDRETQRFFGRLEERADRARNLFLMTKAFTHWAKSAEDEVQRTSVARRHILRTRFFNGWRDITAVNELKIQHFVLAKFLRQWRARAATARDNAHFAVVLYEENLVQRIYREWFFKFCAIAAPAWRNDRTRKITLHKLSEIAKVLRERQEWAVDRYERGMLRKTFQKWRQRTVDVQALEPQAENFGRTALVFSALRTLHKEAQLAPLLRQFQERSNGRIMRNAFSTWQHTAQLSRHARNVDRMRILRNAYTAWNDQLRIKAVEDRINDRIIIESLYKWTLASRVSLFQRVHDRQLKESTFLTWVTRTNQRNNTLDTAERRFAQLKRAQLLRTYLRKMEAITTERRAEEFAVVAEYQQKLKQQIFDKLKERLKLYQQLNKWSSAASFYVLSKSTLKTWSEATQHARRNRRRDTYAQVRRTVKTNLVRRLFANWREKANYIAHLNQQGNDLLENRTMQSSALLLHQWHDRTINLRQQDTQATNVHAFKLETRFFRVWSDRMDALQTLGAQAVALRQESTELAATSALKKLGWRLWNIQRQEENARALYDRNFEKHVRAMLRFWAEQMNDRQANRPVSPTPTSRSRRSRRDDDEDDDNRPGDDDDQRFERDEPRAFDQTGDETQRLETWTAFDENALGLDNDLDLSLSITPDRHQSTTTRLPPQPPSSTRPPPPRSILRPNTYPQPQSSLRPPPQTIPEDSILDPAFAQDIDADFADPDTFWSGTPAAPPPMSTSTRLPFSTSVAGKPGYLKTPSKRSIVRAKRPELPASPEKGERVLSPMRRDLGAMSAPPAQRAGDVGAVGGVTSFQRRLREGGFAGAGSRGGVFSASVAVAGPSGRGQGRDRGRQRVGFGDVSNMG
ncbi:Sfi1-domain-containing protein [Ophiobolus disseminans]|uniref:Sfi1-domain-containing protein n=1 Tax=Ophiobolus disseminans TaxID=1469910 RepID=A0A6A6ZW09_9PLEO|nr:Sfi1-domain-containing protein [Ophiobolus disseminans]